MVLLKFVTSSRTCVGLHHNVTYSRGGCGVGDGKFWGRGELVVKM